MTLAEKRAKAKEEAEIEKIRKEKEEKDTLF